MMNIHLSILWTFIIALCGCSMIRVSQDYRLGTDFSHLKTYRWQPVEDDIRGDAPMDDPLRDERIRNIVERNLYAMGFHEAAKVEPDFFIDFQYSVYSVIEPSGVRRQVGIGRWGGANGTFGGIDDGTGRGRYSRQEGILHIDVIDPKSGHILWRGTGTHQIEQYWKPNTTIEKIDELVDKVLTQFPPTSKF